MSLKICFISNYAYRLFNPRSKIVFGGIETIFYLAAKDLLKDKRFSVSFLLEDDVHRQPATERSHGIELYKTSRQYQPRHFQDKQIEKYHRWFNFWAAKISWLGRLPHFDFFRLWEKIKRIQSDVYVFASPGYESNLLILITKLLRKRSVYIVANGKVLKNKNKTISLKHANLVICFSRRHQELLRKFFKVKSVYLPPWFSQPKKISPYAQRKYCLWVGRIEARKQPGVMIRLAKSLPRLKFLMVVAASPNETALYTEIMVAAAQVPNLLIKQDVMFKALGQYYQNARVLIDTSAYQNLNMTQVQAAGSAVPCLSYNYDPNGSFKSFHWGLSAKGNYQRLVKNVQIISKNQTVWEKLSRAAAAFAHSVYNQKLNSEKLKKILLSLC